MCLCASGRAVHTDSGGEPRDPAQYVVLGDLPAASRSRTFFFSNATIANHQLTV